MQKEAKILKKPKKTSHLMEYLHSPHIKRLTS